MISISAPYQAAIAAKSALIRANPGWRSDHYISEAGQRGSMTSRIVLLGTVGLLALLVALVPVIGVAATGQPATAGTESNASVAPGQQLGAVVDVGQTELENDVDGRAFGLAVAGADTPEAKAAVIKERTDELEARVQGLERRFSELEAARENGSLSEGAYRARATGLAARLTGAAGLANASAAASAGLPADVLAEKGVDVDAIEQLRERASALGGQEIARIARGIAGRDVGSPPGRPAGVPAPPVTPGGPPDTATGGPDNRTAGGPATARSGR